MAQVNMTKYMEWCEENNVEPSRQARKDFEALSNPTTRKNKKRPPIVLACFVNEGKEVFQTYTCDIRERFDMAAALKWRARKAGHSTPRVYVLGTEVDDSKISL